LALVKVVMVWVFKMFLMKTKLSAILKQVWLTDSVYPDSMAAITLSGFLLHSAWLIIALSKAELLIGSKNHHYIHYNHPLYNR
jgi:Co/Zn/Cd efflux system component